MPTFANLFHTGTQISQQIQSYCTKPLHISSGVAQFIVLLTHPSVFRYSDPFRNASVPFESRPANFINFAFKLVTIVTSFEQLQNDAGFIKPFRNSTNPENMVIGPVVYDITCLISLPLRQYFN